MRRFASVFLTVWSLIALPSLVAWLVVVRSGSNGTERFARVWHWSVDRLAYPLVLSPVTDWSWRALETGSSSTAVVGFLTLVAVWTTMLALPLAVITEWWHRMHHRLAPSSYATEPFDPGFSSYPPLPSAPRRSPLAALYIVTIPLALSWAALRRSVSWLGGGRSGVLIWSIVLFVLTSAVVVGISAAMFGLSSYWERGDILGFVGDTVWYGYLDSLRVPRIFQERWADAFFRIQRTSASAEYEDWPRYMGAWYRHPEFRTVVWVTAARHGLVVVGFYLGYRLLRRLF